MLGIVLGVASVIIISSVGSGAQSLVVSQVEELGGDLLAITPGKSDDDGPPAAVMGIVVTTLDYDDLEKIRKKENVPNLVDAYGMVIGVENVVYESRRYSTNIYGVTHGYGQVEPANLKYGRLITKKEVEDLSKVVVLGHTVSEELFGESNPVGRKVKIKKHLFRVIGVMEERGTVAFQNYDDQVLIPLRTMQKLIAGINHLGFVRAKVDNQENIDLAIKDIEIILRESHGISDKSGDSDDFMVRSAAQALEMLTQITDSMRYFLILIAALALLVGGVGIMNIMLVSVTQRTREIGLRKALGATNRNVLNQFLVEAITLTSVGGIIGFVLGVIISYLINVFVHLAGYEDWIFEITLNSVIGAVGVSVIVGFIFGIYPAYRASCLQPVEALRYE